MMSLMKIEELKEYVPYDRFKGIVDEKNKF